MQLDLNPFGDGTGDILLDDVQCRGNETSLADCEHADWGDHDCEHDQDAAVACDDNLAITGNYRITHKIQISINSFTTVWDLYYKVIIKNVINFKNWSSVYHFSVTV